MPSPVTPTELARVLDQRLLLDVRRKSVYEEAADIIPGAVWHDPGEVEGGAGPCP